jgi:hypothetical protein
VGFLGVAATCRSIPAVMHTILLKRLNLPFLCGMCREADRQHELGHRLFRSGARGPAGGFRAKGGRGVVTGNIRGVPMSAMSSPAQAEFYAGLLPVEPSVEPPAVRPPALENDPFPNGKPSLRKRASRALARFLITFCIGVAATLAWQSYGDAARELIVNSYPQLGWLAPQAAPTAHSAPGIVGLAAQAAPSPDQQRLNAISLDLEAIRQNVDRIATSRDQITRSVDRIAPSIVAGQEQMTRSVDRNAASQEQIARSVDQLTAGQERMTHEITKLQAVEQYVLYKNSEPPPRPAPAPVRNPVLRSSQAR